MKVLLSVKPKYVEKIKRGEKKYEFRKVIFKKKVEEIVIYSSSPVKKIVGKFEIGSIVEDKPKKLWKKLKNSAGIDKKEFFKYFSEVEKGFAIEIKEKTFFDNPINPSEKYEDFTPPQSFYYL